MQPTSNHLIPCRNLLSQAHKVFGDIVCKAWVSVPYYIKDPAKLRPSNGKLTDGELRYYPEKGVVLEFCNRRLVEFSTSEWASIRKLDHIPEIIQEKV